MIALVVLGGLLRMLGLGAGLPSINRFFWETDEGVVITNALVIGSGQLHPGTFASPHLYLYVLTGLFGILYVTGCALGWFHGPADLAVQFWSDPTAFYVIARLLSAVCGAATVVAVWHLAKRAYGQRAAWISSGLVAVLPLHATVSGRAESDALATLFATSALLLMVSGPLNARRGWWAGVLAGLAASSKYNAGIPLMGLLVAHFLDVGPRWKSARAHWPLAVGVAGMTMGFALGTPAAIADPRGFMQGLLRLSHENTMTTHPTVLTSGYVPLLHALATDRLFGVGYLAIALGGVGLALMRRTRADLVLLAAVATGVLVVGKPGFGVGTEWLLPAMPALMVLGARAIAAWFGRPYGVAVGIGAAVVVLAGLWVSVAEGMASRDTTFLAAQRWIEGHLPPGLPMAMDDRRVPQLSFTAEALARRREWGTRANSAALLPSRHSGFRDQGLVAMRDRLLTREPAYDLYILLNPSVVPTAPNLFALGPEELEHRFGVKVVILTGWFAGANAPGEPEMSRFYEAVRRDWPCIASFLPNARRSGDAIWVFATPELAARLAADPQGNA